MVASLSRDISELFPYLNAVLRGDFDQERMLFTCSYGERPIVLQAQQVTVGKTEDMATAGEILDAVVAILNKVAAKRETIVPTTLPQFQLSPFDIYKYFPRTNCRDCGEVTCLAFAAGVIQGQHTLEQCPQLKEEKKPFLKKNWLIILPIFCRKEMSWSCEKGFYCSGTRGDCKTGGYSHGP